MERSLNGSSAVEKKSNGKRIALLFLLLFVIVAGLIYSLGDKDFVGKHSSNPAKPIPVGKSIIVPDLIDGGQPNADLQKIYDEENLGVTGDGEIDETAPDYIAPMDLNNYREVDENGNVFLKAPLDGPCGFNADGNVLAPDNYMHVCFYEQNGAILYTSHALIGPRTGALENIRFLEKGQEVTLDEKVYIVDSVDVFLANELPDYLFQPGVVALVTCHIDSNVKTFEDYTKTDVVVLVEK